MLSEAPERTLRMSSLAQRTNATLPRLSHVVRRLEDRGLVERFPAPTTAVPPTLGSPTRAGGRGGGGSGHVDTVRRHVLDPLTPQQVDELREITGALLTRLDPDRQLTVLYEPVAPDRSGRPDGQTSVVTSARDEST